MPRALATAFAFRDKRVEEAPVCGKASGGAVMQQRERADRIGRSVENELGPLRATASCSGMTSDPRDSAAQPVFRHARRECLSARRDRSRCLVNVEAHMAGLDYVTCRKRGAANDVAHVLGKNLFVGRRHFAPNKRRWNR